jgi:hypothetical protein
MHHVIDQLGDISYQFNAQGYRADPFDDGPGCVFLGCSHTAGIGMPQHLTWPSIVSRVQGWRCWNLAIGGGAMDTCFRHCNHWLPQLKPQCVCLLTPQNHRMEIVLPEQVGTLLPTSPDSSVGEWHRVWRRIYPLWTAAQENADLNYEKNLRAISDWCNALSIPLIVMTHQDWKQCRVDLARDLEHAGIDSHQRLADKFLVAIRSQNV